MRVHLSHLCPTSHYCDAVQPHVGGSEAPHGSQVPGHGNGEEKGGGLDPGSPPDTGTVRRGGGWVPIKHVDGEKRGMDPYPTSPPAWMLELRFSLVLNLDPLLVAAVFLGRRHICQ